MMIEFMIGLAVLTICSCWIVKGLRDLRELRKRSREFDEAIATLEAALVHLEEIRARRV